MLNHKGSAQCMSVGGNQLSATNVCDYISWHILLFGLVYGGDSAWLLKLIATEKVMITINSTTFFPLRQYHRRDNSDSGIGIGIDDSIELESYNSYWNWNQNQNPRCRNLPITGRYQKIGGIPYSYSYGSGYFFKEYNWGGVGKTVMCNPDSGIGPGIGIPGIFRAYEIGMFWTHGLASLGLVGTLGLASPMGELLSFKTSTSLPSESHESFEADSDSRVQPGPGGP